MWPSENLQRKNRSIPLQGALSLNKRARKHIFVKCQTLETKQYQLKLHANMYLHFLLLFLITVTKAVQFPLKTREGTSRAFSVFRDSVAMLWFLCNHNDSFNLITSGR